MALTDYDKTVLLLPMSGPNNGIVLDDYSASNKTVTLVGNAKTVTSRSKFYGSSLYLDGTGDYLAINAVCADLVGANAEYTLEGWFYRESDNAGQDVLFGIHTSTGANVAVFTSDGAFGSTFATTDYTGGGMPIGEWFHYAAVRTASGVKAFKNGVKILDIAELGNNDIVSSCLFSIGQEYDSGPIAGDFFRGNVNDVRITKSALYSADFTPPGKMIGSISGTVTDDTNTGAARVVVAFPRVAPTRLFKTNSVGDGSYSLTLPIVEHCRVVLDDDAGTLYNDLIDRVMPG
jgi:hypothetical protein